MSDKEHTLRYTCLTRLYRACMVIATLSILVCASAMGNAAVRYILGSNLPFHEVHIPCVPHSELFQFSAAIAGKTYRCQLVTGTRKTVLPSELLPQCKNPRDSELIVDSAGRLAAGKDAILPEMKLAEFTVQNLPVFVVSSADDTVSASQGAPTIVLGMDAFKGVSLTVDYSAGDMIVRDSQYEAARESRRPDALSLPLMPVKVKGNGAELPCISVIAGTNRLNLVLDTGCCGGDMVIDRRALQHLPELEKIPRSIHGNHFLLGNGDVEVMSPVVISLTSAPKSILLNLDAIIVGFSGGAVDGAIGHWLLDGFVTTFDFPHKNLMLVPKRPTSIEELQLNPQHEVVVHDDRQLVVGSQAVPRLPDGTHIHFYSDRVVVTHAAEEFTIYASENAIRMLIGSAETVGLRQGNVVVIPPGAAFTAQDTKYKNTGKVSASIPIPIFLDGSNSGINILDEQEHK